MKHMMVTVLALATVVAAPALGQDQERREAAQRELEEAQRALRDAERRVRELERELGRDFLRRTIVTGPRGVWVSSWGRPRLGVVVRTARDAATDSIGAVLQAVTPGGPSEKAGLKAGDIVTKLNGEPLVGRYPPASREESEPGVKLVDLARELEEGDTVRIEYRRGGETRTATVIAELLEPEAPFAMALDSTYRIRVAPRIVEPLRELTQSFGYALPSRWLDMELVALNPDLGSYFGTTEGVLVVRAPSDESLNLQSGDVILRIGSRAPTSAAHALRILRSYEPGETVSIEIMRQQRRRTIEAVVPEASSRFNFYFNPEQGRLRTSGGVVVRAPRRDS